MTTSTTEGVVASASVKDIVTFIAIDFIIAIIAIECVGSWPSRDRIVA